MSFTLSLHSVISYRWSGLSLSIHRFYRDAHTEHLYQTSGGDSNRMDIQLKLAPATFIATSPKVCSCAHPTPCQPGTLLQSFPSFPLIADSQRHLSFSSQVEQDFPEWLQLAERNDFSGLLARVDFLKDCGRICVWGWAPLGLWF